jgi:hypothetical protein
MAHRGSTQGRVGHGARAGLLLGLLVSLTLPAVALEVWSPTGLRATIHTPEDIEEQFLAQEGNRLYLRHPAIGELELATKAPGGRDLVTADARVVADALATVQGFRTDLHVNVFILPAFPQIVTSSFARQDAIFLAPAFGVQSDDVLSYIVVHELGHVMCWASLDGRPELWSRYLVLRGLDPQDDPGSLPHAERNREIVAEDYRALFGGPLATASGSIENASLPHPGSVPGLRAFLADHLAGDQIAASSPSSTVYPNPCREQARIELTLSDTASKAVSAVPRLEIYDLRGRLVRRISGGSVANGRASVVWDGRDDGGRRAPGGLYLYRVASGGDLASGRLLLLDR